MRGKFQETYGAKMAGSYLCIDESIVNWDSRHKLLPICVKFADYLKADGQGGERVLGPYEEMTMLTLTYNNQFTIWEALIRQGLLHGRVEINDGQLQRLTAPVLSDNNESLIHKLSRHNLPRLTKVFQGTSIGETRDDANKRYPIFLNFDGKSPLDLALDYSDFDSFQFLLAQTINIQQGFESAYLVDSWLVQAIRLELDLKLLFESKLCTQKLDREMFARKSRDQFPERHSAKQEVIRGYAGGFPSLLHDSGVHAATFGAADAASQRRRCSCCVSKRRREARLEEEAAAAQPVMYQIDYSLTTVQGSEEADGILQALSRTKNMSYFSTAYIQRLISYRFESQFDSLQKLYLLVFVLVYALVLASAALLKEGRESPGGRARQWINGIDAVIVLFLVALGEVQQLVRKGWAYFKDVWNLNDLAFLLCFYGAVTCDALYGVDHEERQKAEATSIFYAALVLVGFCKLLALARINNEFSFIVKMIVRVGEELIPFLVLFLLFIIVFAMAMFILGVDFAADLEAGEAPEANPYEGTGPAAYVFFIMRTSLGDFDLDQFKDLPTISRGASWLFWIVIVISNTVIFLNFLIAVISDVYEQVMETRIEEVFQKQAQILVELNQARASTGKGRRRCRCRGKEANESEKEANESASFAKILITRAGVVVKGNSKLWSGYLSEIKRCLTAQSTALQTRVDWLAMNQERDFDTRISQTNEQIQSLANQVSMVQMQLVLVFKELRHDNEPSETNGENDSSGAVSRKSSPSVSKKRTIIESDESNDEDADLAKAVQKIVQKALAEQNAAQQKDHQ